jgi:hypothetical protein
MFLWSSLYLLHRQVLNECKYTINISFDLSPSLRTFGNKALRKARPYIMGYIRIKDLMLKIGLLGASVEGHGSRHN